MNILFYLEPLIIQDNPYLYCGWLPLWSQLIKTLDKSGGKNIQYKLITSQAVHSVISQFNMPDFVDIIPIPLEAVVEKFNFSSMDASLAWYQATYSDEQIEHTARLFARELDGWVPDVIITSSQVPFLKKNYPKATVLYFEGGMTSRPPFPPSWYLDPVGLYKFSFLAENSAEINKEPLNPSARDLLKKYRNFFVSVIDSKDIFSQFAESYRYKFSHVILLPLQTEGFWFHGNCDYSSEFQLVHKLLSTIDPNIGVVVTPHPSNPWFTNEIVQYFESKFPNFLYFPDVLRVSSASQYLLEHVDAVLSVSSMVGLQALIWKKKLFSIGETQLKVGADYCFKPDLNDIERLPELLKIPATDKDNVLFWLLTRFYVPEHYFFDPTWLLNYITRVMQANSVGNISLNVFNPIDEPEKVFSHIFKEAILDIPRYRDRELETPTYTFEEKVNELQKVYGGLQENSEGNLWFFMIERIYDQEILFSAGEINSSLLINGWSQIEEWGVWSQGPVADIVIRLPANSGKDVNMRGVFLAFVNEKHPVQMLDVFVNEEKLDSWRFEHERENSTYQLIIPATVFERSPSQTHIRFTITSPVSPASLGLSKDTRLLGIGMHSLQFILVE